MSFLVAGFGLLMALLLGIVIDGGDTKTRRESKPDVPPFE
jgi:hypothetical protein